MTTETSDLPATTVKKSFASASRDSMAATQQSSKSKPPDKAASETNEAPTSSASQDRLASIVDITKESSPTPAEATTASSSHCSAKASVKKHSFNSRGGTRKLVLTGGTETLLNGVCINIETAKKGKRDKNGSGDYNMRDRASSQDLPSHLSASDEATSRRTASEEVVGNTKLPVRRYASAGESGSAVNDPYRQRRRKPNSNQEILHENLSNLKLQETHQQSNHHYPSPTKKLFIGGINSNTSERSLRLHFEKFGVVDDVMLKGNRGFAFVVYRTAEEAELALTAANSHIIDGKRVEAKRAVSKQEVQSKTRSFNFDDSSEQTNSNLKGADNQNAFYSVPSMAMPYSYYGAGMYSPAGMCSAALPGYIAPYSMQASDRRNSGRFSSNVVRQNDTTDEPKRPTEQQSPPRAQSPDSSKPQVEARKLFVGGLNARTIEPDLVDYFCRFGPVENAAIMIDPATQRSRGFGFVTFMSAQAAKTCLNFTESHVINSKTVDVKTAIIRQGAGNGSVSEYAVNRNYFSAMGLYSKMGMMPMMQPMLGYPCAPQMAPMHHHHHHHYPAPTMMSTVFSAPHLQSRDLSVVEVSSKGQDADATGQCLPIPDEASSTPTATPVKTSSTQNPETKPSNNNSNPHRSPRSTINKAPQVQPASTQAQTSTQTETSIKDPTSVPNVSSPETVANSIVSRYQQIMQIPTLGPLHWGGFHPQHSHQLTYAKIFIGGLRRETTRQQLEQYFGSFGKIRKLDLVMDPDDETKNRGFAFIQYEEVEACERACQMQFHAFDGHSVEVKRAVLKQSGFDSRGITASAGGAFRMPTYAPMPFGYAAQPMQYMNSGEGFGQKTASDEQAFGDTVPGGNKAMYAGAGDVDANNNLD